MSVTVQAPTRAEAGDVVNPRANNAREQVFSSQVMDWAMRGYLFTASQGLEATDIATVTTEADTTPTATLQAPAGSSVVVIPLRVWVSLTNDGGGLTTLDLSYTKAAAQCATAMTLSGTALNVQNHYTPNPMTTPSATTLHGVTASALLTTDYITLAHHHWIDAALTTGLIVPDFDYVFKAPLALVAGAALMLHGYTASSAGKFLLAITWAEVPASVYVP
jgi:hypothetical protein